jgi:hypothetical protein
MSFEHLAENVEELDQKYSRWQIAQFVSERHPGLCMPALDLFILTYVEVHGGTVESLCDIAKRRLNADNVAFWGRHEIPLYFVRCLLPNCVVGPAA